MISCTQLIHNAYNALHNIYEIVWHPHLHQDIAQVMRESCTHLLTAMHAMHMPMTCAIHYICNHMMEDISLFGNVSSLICEGTERANQFANRVAVRCALSDHMCVCDHGLNRHAHLLSHEACLIMLRFLLNK